MADDSTTRSYFEDPEQASNYQRFRPTPPSELINKILGFLKEKLQPPFKQAVDVGCGSGGSTKVLAEYFDKVTGYDISVEQIKQANQETNLENIFFRVGQCDKLDLDDNSAELITCGTAAHWFNLEAFYKEVDRILVPNGVLALYSNFTPMVSNPNEPGKLESVFVKYWNEWIFPFMPDDTKHIRNQYRTLPLPYSEVIDYRDEQMMDFIRDVTVSDIAGYIRSTSAYQLRVKKFPDQKDFLIQEIQNRLMKALNASGPPEKTSVRMIWKYFLVMVRKGKL